MLSVFYSDNLMYRTVPENVDFVKYMLQTIFINWNNGLIRIAAYISAKQICSNIGRCHTCKADTLLFK